MNRPLRILHLFANYKWTGPADPAIRGAARLRDVGADVLFAQAEWTLPGAEHRMQKELRRARMPVVSGLSLRKHFHPPALLRDARALRARLSRGEFEVVHAHLLGDHLVAALARRGVARRVVLVRSVYDPEPPPRDWRHRLAMRNTDGLVAPTMPCAERARARFGLPPARVLVQEPPIEPRPAAEGCAAAPDGPVAAQRRALGLAERDIAVGITARIQPHRRFDLLWAAAQQVVAAEPRVRFVLLGRGNDHDLRTLVHEPVAARGLGEHVVLPGYLYEPHYGAALRGLDLFLFLVPGSDGTCRAVREAMAVGLPVVATPRGMLPAMLDAGAAQPCGVVAQEDPAALAVAILQLVRDPDARRRLGARAREKARSAMDPDAAARRLLGFYQRLWDGAR